LMGSCNTSLRKMRGTRPKPVSAATQTSYGDFVVPKWYNNRRSGKVKSQR
jgi:hypothetical protein